MALLLLFLLFALVHSTTTADIGLLDRVFKGDYNRLVAPAGRHGRTRVVMTLSEAWSLTDVDDRGQVVSFRGSFFMSWFDPRLAWSLPEFNFTGARVRPDEIWLPRVGFPRLNLAEPAYCLHDVKLHYSGFVEAFGEIHTSILCQMDAARFPFDAHSCAIRLDSYDSIELAALVDEVTAPALPHVSGWLTSNIQLGSAESFKGRVFTNRFEKAVEMDDVEPALVDEWRRIGMDTNVLSFSHVEYRLEFERIPTTYLATYWFPINFLAIIGLHGILLGCKSAERYSFGATLLVAIGLFTIGIYATLPPGTKLPLLARTTTGIYFIVALTLLFSASIARGAEQKGGRFAKPVFVGFLVALLVVNAPVLFHLVDVL